MFSLFRYAVFLRPVVHDDVAIFVFDPEPSGGVAGFLPAVSVDRLHGAVWILPPLVVSRVDLPLACVEKDLLGAVPERGSTHSHPVSLHLKWRQVRLRTNLIKQRTAHH